MGDTRRLHAFGATASSMDAMTSHSGRMSTVIVLVFLLAGCGTATQIGADDTAEPAAYVMAFSEHTMTEDLIGPIEATYDDASPTGQLVIGADPGPHRISVEWLQSEPSPVDGAVVEPDRLFTTTDGWVRFSEPGEFDFYSTKLDPTRDYLMRLNSSTDGTTPSLTIQMWAAQVRPEDIDADLRPHS